jgi:tetratricopeptide (TPR) repeat protein
LYPEHVTFRLFPAYRIFAAAILLVLGSSASARADDSANVEAATKHFTTGSRAYDLAQYDKALREFLAAQALMPAPQIGFNVAQCYEKLGRLQEAIAGYERYVSEVPDDPDLPSVRARIGALKAKLPPPPPPVVEAPPRTEAPPLVAPSPTPVYKRWWLWTIVGVVVVAGVGVGLGLGLGQKGAPDSTLGVMPVTF